MRSNMLQRKGQEMARKPAPKYIIADLDRMRAELAVTANKLAGASGCSLATMQSALAGVPLSRNVCERIILGLQREHHQTANLEMIVSAPAP